jgi:hypothetical protein
MITKNGSRLFGQGRIMYPDIVSVVNKAGTNVTIAVRDLNGDISKYGLYVGSGTTPPTLDDIDLENEFTSSVLSFSENTWSASGSGNVVFTRSFTNITNENLTISEIALYTRATSPSCLLAREVLGIPRTVAPNETVTFSFEIAFN